MGKKEDKLALNAYQAASLMGAFGQGFASPDSGYYRTAAALSDSAQGAIAAQSNYMAQKAAKKKKSGLGGIGGAAGLAVGALLAAPTGGMSLAAGAALGGAVGGSVGGIADSAIAGDSAGALQGAANLGVSAAGAYDRYNTPKTTVPSGTQVVPQTPGARVPLSPEAAYGNVPAAPASAVSGAAKSLGPEAPPAGMTTVTPAQNTGDWLPVAIGGAAALGAGALVNNFAGPETPKARITDPSQVLPGGMNPNMTPAELRKQDPIWADQWAKQYNGKMTRRQYNALPVVTQQKVQKPAGFFQTWGNGLLKKTPQEQYSSSLDGRYTYVP